MRRGRLGCNSLYSRCGRALVARAMEVQPVASAGRRALRMIPVCLTLVAILYLALKPSPDPQDIPLLPTPIARWLAHHDTFDNVGAFAVLAAMVHWTFSGWRREPARVLVWRVVWLEALVIGLEFVQYFLPRRSCDWRDMLAGLAGIVIATLPWLGFGAGRARGGAG
jgi:VanZ like family